MSRFSLTIDSTLSQLFLISVVVRGVCEHLKADPAQSYSLELCAVEAVTNAIRHAYHGASGFAITLEVSFTEDRVDLCVRDQGVSMPDEQIGKLANGSRAFEFDPQCLESVPEGGLGLEIIRHEMDEAEYSTESGYNCLRLTRYLASSPAQ